MPLSAKALSLIGGIGAGCWLIPYSLNKKTNNHIHTPEVVSSSSQLNLRDSSSEVLLPNGSEAGGAVQDEIKKESEEENCEIVKSSEDVFWDLLLSDRMSSFYTIACKNSSISSDDKRMEGEWSALFPDVLMTDRQNLKEGTSLGIKTVTTSAGERKHKTVFTGSKLQNSSVTGEWGNELKQAGDKWVTTVTVSSGLSSSDSIYLLFSENNS